MSKFNLLVIFLLLIICGLIAAIYYQSSSMNKNALRVMKTKPVHKSDGRRISIDLNADRKTAQIYYIDRTNGDNRAAGTSMDEPWKDFFVLNKISFAKGDKILLKRGEVWNQTLISPAGGTEKEPIIIDAYGSGKLPVIDVQNKYSAAIRIYYSYISINNIRVQNSKNTCVAISVDGGLNSIELNQLKIFNAGNNGIGISNGGTKLTITNCYIENARNNGIYLGGSAENKLSNVIVLNCHIKNISHNDGITIHEDENGNTAGSNFLLKNNISEMCGEQGFDITSGNNVLLLNNISNNNKQGGIVVGHSAQYVTIKGHLSTDEPTEKTSAAINLSGDYGNIRLLNNIIKGNGYHLLLIRTNNVAVFNNNFIWNGGNAPIDIFGKIENIHFINNIVYSKQNKMSRIRFLEVSRPPDYHSFYFDNNLYYVPGNEVIFYYNKKNYNFKRYQKSFNVEMNSDNINPEFVNVFQNDYQLKRISPAIDRGCFYTHLLSQEAKNSLVVENTLFFYKNFLSDDYQCIMLKGVNETFNVIDVNYKNNTITLNKDIKFDSASTKELGACYNQSSLDIGTYELGSLQQTAN